VEVRADVVEELGADVHVFFPVDAAPVVVEARDATDDSSMLPGGGTLFCARIEPDALVPVGATVPLAVDLRRAHFFDPETGASLLASEQVEGAVAEAVTP
jgi:multiple sugar transport system ATP-binding protein